MNPSASRVTPELVAAVERELAPVETVLTERAMRQMGSAGFGVKPHGIGGFTRSAAEQAAVAS